MNHGFENEQAVPSVDFDWEAVDAVEQQRVADLDLEDVLSSCPELARELERRVAQTGQRIIAEVVAAKDRGYAADCLALALGAFDFDTSVTETQLAKRHGVTRAAVSKRVLSYCDMFGLTSGVKQKAGNLRGVYSEAQRRRRKGRCAAGG